MKTIKTSIFILPSLILLLSACTSIETKETSMNDKGHKSIIVKNEVTIDPSLTGIFSRFFNILLGKPVIDVEPIVLSKEKEEPVENKPKPILEKGSKCAKIMVKTSDSLVTIDC